jgi:hypothetical protein
MNEGLLVFQDFLEAGITHPPIKKFLLAKIKYLIWSSGGR